MQKNVLRISYIERRKSLDKAVYEEMNKRLVETLREVLESAGVTRVAAFFPIGNEVDLRSLNDRFTLYLPKVETGGLSFYEDTGKYVPAPFGTTVPDHDVKVETSSLDAIVVPGLVYDKSLYRLGYGKGYYDSFLKGYNGLKIGVCFSMFIVEQLPIESHDVCVDMLVTEQGVWKR